MTSFNRDEARDLLFREALALDRRDWPTWISLYTEDARFWMPAWRDEVSPTEDPDRELSLIYYEGRANLEERVWRIQSGLSVASTPIPRTAHIVSNVMIDNGQVHASFVVHVHDVRSGRTHAFFGRYEYLLRKAGINLAIHQKKIILMNDKIPTVADIYMV